jgi:CspA family cold shock protein
VTRGHVSSFDAPSGLGVLTTADGVEFPFHCVEIADGTRTIDVGIAVEFEPLRKLGRIEAASVRPVGR